MTWENPNEFIQRKFCVDYKGDDFEFLPFGSGRRKCPGISFAITSIRL